MQLDAISVVILSPYEYSKSEIVTAYLFADYFWSYIPSKLHPQICPSPPASPLQGSHSLIVPSQTA